MARAGEVVADTLALLGEHARPGVTTQELDELADEFIRSRGGTPTFKGYRGYPASICASPNEMVVHGIPGMYALRDGDILSVDVGVTLDGFVADSAYTFAIGEVSEEAERLLEGCQAALAAGIEQCRVGNRLSDISHAIQVATEEQGFSVVRSLVGHGVGRSMHEEPQIPNYGEPGRGPLLAEGMTFAIEPMITAGGADVVLHDDEWSISSADGSLAAHFEHTVAITADGRARDPSRPATTRRSSDGERPAHRAVREAPGRDVRRRPAGLAGARRRQRARAAAAGRGQPRRRAPRRLRAAARQSHGQRDQRAVGARGAGRIARRAVRDRRLHVEARRRARLDRGAREHARAHRLAASSG